MSVGRDSVRLQVVVSKADKALIEAEAGRDNRSVSNWIYSLIRAKLKSRK
jgi:hypothetical protein